MDHGKMTTETNNPCRERSVQTSFNTFTDVGVQCQRDLDDEWDFAFDPPANKSSENKGIFLSYVSQNTSMFSNGMLECLVCGEIANFLQEHQSHMAMHFGPRELCSACGQWVGHQRLMSQHSYSCPSRPNAKSRPVINIQCPHLHCSVMVHSKRELAKHLCKHFGVKSYYCLQCRNSFSSSAHFLAHRMLKNACYKSKLIYFSKKSAQLWQKLRSKRCTVCLKQFSSTSSCLWHRRRCILSYQKRMKTHLNLHK